MLFAQDRTYVMVLLMQGRRHLRSWEGHVPTTFAGCTTQGYNSIYVVRCISVTVFFA